MKIPRLVYIGDPMCSWCWGIAPEVERLDKATTLPLDVVVGGLRPGPSAEQMRPSMQQFLAEHWRHVEERTGQPFDHAILDDHTWIYDTETACAAVVTMRTLLPTHALPFFSRLQRAFYAEGVNITDPDAIRPLLEGFEVDADSFMTDLSSAEIKKATWKDFAWARSIGVSSFPTVALEDDDGLRAIALGYSTADEMFNRLVSALPAEIAAATCSVNGAC